MEYIYYKDPNGNFGDDLNGWLWPQLFDYNSTEDNDYAFLGIGSILYNENKLIKDLKDRRKIVFGTGIRSSYEAFKYDETWNMKFLRGPLSSYSLNNKFEYISDAAYALRLIKDFDSLKNTEKKHEISLMPYFRSIQYFDWKSICDKLGYNYISPLSENGVEFTLKEIAASKHLITEAMHGAILADVLRVPWNRYVFSTPITEGVMVSEFKWMDWLSSISLGNINTTYIKFNRKTFLNPWIKKISGNILDVEFFIKKVVSEEILSKLKNIEQFYLSNDSVIADIDSKIGEKVLEFRRELEQ